MGLMSTVINVYTARDGQWSITAIVSGCVIGAWLMLSIVVFLIYDIILIPRVEQEHLNRENGIKASSSAIHYTITLIRSARRK